MEFAHGIRLFLNPWLIRCLWLWWWWLNPARQSETHGLLAAWWWSFRGGSVAHVALMFRPTSLASLAARYGSRSSSRLLGWGGRAAAAPFSSALQVKKPDFAVFRGDDGCARGSPRVWCGNMEEGWWWNGREREGEGR